MKFRNVSMYVVVMLGVLLFTGVALASGKNYEKETQEYKEAVAVWAKRCAVSRVNALNTYHGVRIVVENVVWSERSSGNHAVKLFARCVNTSAVSATITDLILDFRDHSGRQVDRQVIHGSFKLGPGDQEPFTVEKTLSAFEQHSDSVLNGNVSVQTEYRVVVDDVEFGKGTLEATGAPFVGNRPRDPFWLEEKEINVIVGSAEMQEGVYDQDVKFPERGWWPIVGMNGQFSGKTPGPMANAAPVIVDGPAYLQNSGENRSEEEGMKTEDGIKAAKDTVDVGKSAVGIIRSLGSLF